MFDLLEYFVVIVADHGVHEDGVDDTQSYYPSCKQKHAEIKSYHVNPAVAYCGTDGVRYLVPAFHGAYSENGVDGVERCAEVLGRQTAEDGTVEHARDDDKYQKTNKDRERLPHGKSHVAHYDGEVGEEMNEAEETEDAEKPECE